LLRPAAPIQSSLRSSGKSNFGQNGTTARTPKVTGRKGGSEDFYALEVGAWTPELERYAQELEKDFGLLKPDNVAHTAAGADEFPRQRGNGGPTSELQSQFQTARSAAAASAVANIKRANGRIKPDAKWPNMWRIQLRNGQLTDMANLTRATDAARSLWRSGL
jgi:hypothetical protein